MAERGSPYPISLDLKQKQSQSLKQLQRLIMSRQMQQAIHLLQLPIMELSAAIELEVEQNPILEYTHEEDNQNPEDQVLEEEEWEEEKLDKALSFNEKDFEAIRKIDEEFRDSLYEELSYTERKTAEHEKLQTFLESSIIDEISLNEHLIAQARETFETQDENAMAEAIIGSLDENGYLSTPLTEIAHLNHFNLKVLEQVLATIQTFEPYGIGAQNLQECLLIQLRCKGKSHSLAYMIVEKHFEDLLHNRIPSIIKGLGCSSKEIGEAISRDISALDLHPGGGHGHQIVQQIVPDVTIRQEGEELIVEINDDSLPPLRLNSRYLKMLNDETLNQETKDFIRHKIMSARWLLRNILQRNDTLERISSFLAKKQKDFFLNPEGKLTPLTMRTVADELQLHESTIARAVAHKYVNSPRGLLPLRSFFTNGLEMDEGGEISSNTARGVLSEIVKNEDKSHPLSDEAICAQMKARGIHCARRTIAKYRAELNLGNAQQRKKY